jgi:sec-independent protein translocase protein TatC
MSLGEHLRELRRRVLVSVLALLGATVLAFVFWEPIWAFVRGPYEEAAARQAIPATALQALDPGEGFFQVMKLCFLAALVVSSPVVLLQMWGFVSAGLFPRERRAVRVFFPVSLGLFLLGVVAAYLLLIPLALSFLMGWDVTMGVGTGFRVSSYVSLCLTMVIAMGLCFELPLVILFLEATGLVSRDAFRKWWRLAVVLAFVVGMIVTPDPSPVSQTALALPLVGLYFLGIWGGRFVGEGRERFRWWKAWPLALGAAVFVALLVFAGPINDWWADLVRGS